jgi:hypothetical protein
VIKQDRDLQDLSRHSVRQELRKIAESYVDDISGDSGSNNSIDNGGGGIHSKRRANGEDMREVDAVIYQDPALVKLRDFMLGGRCWRNEC